MSDIDSESSDNEENIFEDIFAKDNSTSDSDDSDGDINKIGYVHSKESIKLEPKLKSESEKKAGAIVEEVISDNEENIFKDIFAKDNATSDSDDGNGDINKIGSKDDKSSIKLKPKLKSESEKKAGQIVEEVINKEWVQTEKEKKLSNILFGNRDNFLENLEKSYKEQYQENIQEIKRERKWIDSDDETVDTTRNYKRPRTEFVKNKFENTIGQPSWADLDRNLLKNESDDSDDEVLRTVGHLKSTKSKTNHLPKGSIQIKVLKDLNRMSYREGPTVSALEFHPSSMVALLAGRRGCATLFSVDGQKNDQLHSMLFKDFLIYGARFNKNGSEIIFGGNKNVYYTFDLLSGVTDKLKLPNLLTKLKYFEISPDEKHLIAAGRFGELHLFDAKTKELLTSYKQEHEVTALSFNPDSNRIFSHSDNNEVTIFDIRSQKILSKFYDDGCINGTSISISPNSQLIATGNGQGVVNVYNYQDCLTQINPEPLKRVFNLSTSISCTKFNPTSEILSFCSNNIENALRLLHFPSCTVFSNFPLNLSKFGRPNIVNFSPGGKYMAIGNLSSQVKLFSIKHYINY